MANKAHLMKRNGVWHFNKAYPKKMWQVTETSPFRMSLLTGSLEVAMRARPDAERLYWVAVDAAAAKIESLQPRQFTELEALGLVAKWLKDEDVERLETVAATHSLLLDI